MDHKLQKDVSMMQTATYSMGHRVWTNANLAKEFVKVKTYSDLLVLRQDANDKLGEPARWVLYVSKLMLPYTRGN